MILQTSIQIVCCIHFLYLADTEGKIISWGRASFEHLIPDSVPAFTVALGRISVWFHLLKCISSIALCSEGNSPSLLILLYYLSLKKKNVVLYYLLSFVSMYSVETTNREVIVLQVGTSCRRCQLFFVIEALNGVPSWNYLLQIGTCHFISEVGFNHCITVILFMVPKWQKIQGWAKNHFQYKHFQYKFFQICTSSCKFFWFVNV